MKLPRRRFLGLAAGAAALSAVSHFAWAQAYPTRPVTMVVTFPAGSGSDILVRILGPSLSEFLGQQVIIEDVGGAGGITAAYRVARAAPDGYQFVLGGTDTFAQSQTLYKTPPYNAITDFAPVALIVEHRSYWSRATICPPATCRSSSLTRRPISQRCNSARPDQLPGPISHAHT